MAVYYNADVNGNPIQMCGSDSYMWMDQRLSIWNMVRKEIEHVRNNKRKPAFMKIEIWFDFNESHNRYLTDFIKID